MSRERTFHLLVVTGLSGAGKSTAINVFEDLGYFSVDGLPAGLLPKMAELVSGRSREGYRGLVLGMDLRQHDFLDEWKQALEKLRALDPGPEIVFIDARSDVLLKRYAVTRRPHPLEGADLGLDKAIEEEGRLLRSVKAEADVVIDTSDYSIHDLRRRIQDLWAEPEDSRRRLRVHLVTFGFKYGLPPEADLVFDLRFLPNPYFVDALRPLTGRDRVVADYVLEGDPGRTFLARMLEFLNYILPLYEHEGRYRLTVAIGCTGGKHRSVAVAEAALAALKAGDYAVSLEHRHMELG